MCQWIYPRPCNVLLLSDTRYAFHTPRKSWHHFFAPALSIARTICFRIWALVFNRQQEVRRKVLDIGASSKLTLDALLLSRSCLWDRGQNYSEPALSWKLLENVGAFRKCWIFFSPFTVSTREGMSCTIIREYFATLTWTRKVLFSKRFLVVLFMYAGRMKNSPNMLGLGKKINANMKSINVK